MTPPAKLDLYRENKGEYVAPRKPVLVDIRKATYLATSGRGAPGGEEFQRRIGALYGMAYTVKMSRKFAGAGDYTVCKLECQWWAGDESVPFSELPPAEWCWRLLIRTPAFITAGELARARKALAERGKGELTGDVRLERFTEGRCVQMLHVGPYDQEADTIAAICSFAAAQGLELHGRHHEIYLSDPRRVEPERLKTILRIPVRKRR